jgi:hypothetical protein
MESRQFVWSLAKLVVVVKHLADQKRHNNAYSGQAREKAYEMDIAYYASCDEFTSANVTKRQLHGKEGLYDKIYGHAAALRSQLCELGKERTEIQMSENNRHFRSIVIEMQQSRAFIIKAGDI